MQQIFDATVTRFGAARWSVQQRGDVPTGAPLDTIAEEDVDQIMAVNVKGTWLCLGKEVHVMERQGLDAIVNVSSIGGLRGSPGMGAYQATKHAVIGLTRTAAHDFGPIGIR
ncbi:NAD(P)-dependent dehydrogenase (short-subunit alcohol dehydrogenase family) [Pseudonocardia eucalypti]|uniref:SDR family oxidoreductase n=1 Tax=Pseudonocardia eucalypti TaxID=648755 RepID=UPI0018508541|nr:NAD(P)-dependent dehydrogenase (short-subunit alcohol dehydrogenase family) [Pseudonocardia eucalypti]